MQYNKADYEGRNIQLYPGDTFYKYGTITKVDDLGWTVKITKSAPNSNNHWKVGKSYFISHSTNFVFEFVD
jgi:hypothetical protein